MKKRFILALQGTTKDENESFRSYLKGAGLNWWHWLPGLWLIIDDEGKWSAGQLRDKAKEFYPGEHILVVEMPASGDTWAGFGPTSEKKNMFTWIKRDWSNK